MPGAAHSWYHEKETAWLYGVVTAAEPDPARRADPAISPHFKPVLRARVVARLLGASID